LPVPSFLTPVVGHFTPIVEGSTVMLTAVSLGLAILGIVLAWYFYLVAPGMPYLIAYQAQSLYELLLHKYYIDEVYNTIVTRPLFWVSTFVLGNVVDSFMIDGLVNVEGLTVA